jgi:hypothetical protein
MATTGTTKAKRPSVDAILDALCQHPGATAAELAEAAGIGRSTASKTLASLEADGQVTSQRAASESGKPAPDRWTLIVDTPASDVDHATPERRPTTAGEPAAQPVSTTTSDAEERGDEPAPPVTTPDPEGDAVTEGALDTLYRLTPNSSRPRLAVYRMAATAPPYPRPEIIRGQQCAEARLGWRGRAAAWGSASGSLTPAGGPPLSRHGCQAPRALSRGHG